ncbi:MULTISPECIES: cysteine desulfurase family protein [Vagococcus]|uniref:Cysteine desulfurase n=1 Tax=Vagococcus fluvialis bH819 TaxID=1255619 RepID=A0A1X6WNP8_9ENTE|nr:MULTISPECIES: cysteine desulfurase family protein [Vagococcus]SLM85296.1 Cysteine desulfurase [Vagococcus fluvialis bH819]HCM89408.1 cysteine desulfurase [Vagococcus sp.]
MIYFDNSATTAIEKSVLETYKRTSERFIGNPSSLHRLGEQANVLLDKSRAQIADQLQVKKEELYFTSGGTESNNWALKGTAIEKRPFGNHMIISSVEHPSVSETAKQLEQLGFEVTFIPVSKKGVIDVEALKASIKDETILVSTIVVNSEVGVLQPIKEISDVLKAYPNIHYHVDAVQAVGKIPTEDWLTSRVDFASLSAHKFHGPRGVGILYWKKGCKLAPLLTGGGQENNKRSTTENIPGIVSTARATRLLFEDAELKANYIRKIRNYLEDALAKFHKVTIFSPEDESLKAPHILCVGIKGIRGEVLVHALEDKEIFVSTTSACSSKKKMASSTLHSMGIPSKLAETAIRISLDEKNTLAEAEQFLIVFRQLYDKFEKING